MTFDLTSDRTYISAMAGKTWEHTLKELGFRWIGQSAPQPFSRPTGVDLRQARRILVVRLDDRIGNAVLITPLLMCLKQACPQARLSCLLSARFFNLAEFLPSVDQFIPYHKRAYAQNPFRLWRLVRRLQREHFDLVFDASDELELSFNHALTTAYSGGRFRVGYDRRGSARWLEVPVPPGNPTRHAVDMHLDLLRALAPVAEIPRPMLDLRQVNAFGSQFRHTHRVSPGESLVVMHPGGRGPKRWPLARFLALAEEMRAQLSLRPVLVWGPAENRMIRSAQSGWPSGLIRGGVLPVPDLISLLKSSAAYLSNDNGIMHLASACGVPTIGIFVVSNAAKYRPLGPQDRVFDEARGPVRDAEIIEELRAIVGHTRATATVIVPSPEYRGR